MLKWIVSAIDLPNRWVGLTIRWLVLLMMGMTMFEVIARFAFNSPTKWAQETTEQMFGFYLIMGGGYILLSKAHIRIDVLWSRLSPRKGAAVDLATAGVALLFTGVLLWFSIRMARESVLLLENSPSVWGPLLYPLKVSLAIGALLLFLQLIAKTIRDLYLVIKGDELA